MGQRTRGTNIKPWGIVMSLSSLRSEVSRLESILSEVEAENSRLRNELNTVISGVSQAHNTLENYNAHVQNTLQNSNDIIHSSHQRVIAAYEIQGEIERLYKRFKSIESANKKIREANQKKYYEFANYRTVRKIVQGIMDNLDVHMISDKVITKTIEVQHLQTPDYWLTCVLISVMAWKNDDKELADRAMARAISLDKKYSAIFYMLFNLRMQRNEAALKWFVTYQECEQKGSDRRTFLMLFSLISKTINESVDESTKSKISTYINNIIISSAQAEGYSEADIVAKVRNNYTRLRSYEELEYPLLRKCCGAFNELTANMMLAKNNINILEFILKVINVSVEQKNMFFKNYVDEIIAAPNQAEKTVYEEIAYNELVIKLEGDEEAAKAQHSAELKRAETQINLVSEIVGWIYERDNQDISGQMRLNMFTLTKNLQEKAIGSYTEDYRSRKKTVLPVAINDYSSNVDFTRETEEIKKVETHYTDIKDSSLAAIKDWKAFVGFGIAGLAVAGAFYVGFWLLALTAVGIICGVFVLLSNKSRRNLLELTCQDNIRGTTGILQKIFNEFRQYQTQFNDYDAYHDKIVNELNKI
jgi:hypothetical protein